jgi:4-hydroxybenzoate polyprenyltransferase
LLTSDDRHRALVREVFKEHLVEGQGSLSVFTYEVDYVCPLRCISFIEQNSTMNSTALPLVVDLDGTLNRTDSLVEALIGVGLRRPSALPGTIMALLQGRPALKDHVAKLGFYSGEVLPLRPELLSWLEAEKGSGRELHLATAADQTVADTVAKRVGLFTSAIGSCNGVNLKGRNKLAALKAKFPDGFAYAGNDRADLEVWPGASSMVLVGVDASTRRKALRFGLPVEREFPKDDVSLKTWLKAGRLHQWSKNILLFVPLLLAHKYADVSAIVTVALGFSALGCVASGTYLINDLSDLDADRVHKTKRNRPLASGAISAASGFAAAVILIVGGLSAAYMVRPAFAAAVGVYVGVTLAYSMHLKKLAMLDVFVLGVLYTLRIFMGMVLIKAAPSPWLLSFAMFFFFSLSMAKRHVEIVRAAETGLTGGDKTGGQTEGFIKGRGYKASDAPLSLSFGVASSLAAILVLFLYVVHEAFPAGAYRHPQWLWIIGFLVFLWTSRIWLLSHRGELDDDPVAFAVKDGPSLLIGLLVLGTFALAVL